MSQGRSGAGVPLDKVPAAAKKISSTSVAPITVSDRTCMLVFGIEWRVLRAWLDEQGIPYSRIGRRPVVRVAAVVAALEGEARYDENEIVRRAAWAQDERRRRRHAALADDSSPKNDQLYRPVSADDPGDPRARGVIRQHGVREPLVVSADNWLLSGHRRRVASEVAGLGLVPVRVERVRRDEDPDHFVRLLREYNRQRVKGFDEKLREAVIDADPRNAVASWSSIGGGGRKPDMSRFRLGRVEGEVKSVRRTPMANAIKAIVDELKDYWPLTVRQIDYALLNNPPLRHASKPDSGYVNDKDSYKSADELSVRMRLTDPSHWAHVPMEAIGDETRPVTTWEVHADVGSFVRRESAAS